MAIPTETTAWVSGALDHDGALVARTCAGEREAFEQLFARYQNRIYRLALGLLGDAEEAHDATQDAFVRAYRQLRSFRGDSAFLTWLYRIGVNQCLTRLRKRRRHAEAMLSVGKDLPVMSDGVAERAVEVQRVREVVNQLSAAYRVVLVLRFWHELSLQEIADVTGSTAPQIKMRLHRARKAFARRYLADTGSRA